MIELDHDLAAFWRATLHHSSELNECIHSFSPSRERIEQLSHLHPRDVLEHGFRTLVLNRTRRGGVLAPGASLTKRGENNNGVASRWYPETLIRRLEAIHDHAAKLTFCEGDGMRLLEDLAIYRTDACFFLDPPYTADGGKRAGSRLYAHNSINHAKLFEIMASSSGDFLMTYDCSDEIVSLVQKHQFHAAVVLMKNCHHARLPELVITRERLFT